MSQHRHRRRGRAVGRAARRDGDRAAGHAVRPLPGHAAHRACAGRYGNALPDRILLFQGPHEREAEDEDDLIVSIGETLIHEIGHYFGMSEEEIEEIEEKYWSGGVTMTRSDAPPQALRTALSRASLGRRRSIARDRAAAGGRLPRDRPGPRRADATLWRAAAARVLAFEIDRDLVPASLREAAAAERHDRRGRFPGRDAGAIGEELRPTRVHAPPRCGWPATCPTTSPRRFCSS